MVTGRSVALSALGYLRSTHLPTYAAARLLLEAVNPSRLDSFVSDIVDIATERRHSRTLSLKRFKARDAETYHYRDYSVPSPTECLADAYAIALVNAYGINPGRKFVFSYRPSASASTRSFEHFSIGYRERNAQIEAALADSNRVALIADVRSFYPETNFEAALTELMRRVKSSGASPRDARIIEASAMRAAQSGLDGSVKGLRVGPEISHVLADISLGSIDAELASAFPGGYFRYVDDIALVVERRRLQEAKDRLANALAKSDLQRSVEKDAVVDLLEWSGHRSVEDAGSENRVDALARLKFRIKLFLARRPNDAGPLQESLVNSGVFLPIDQLRQGSFERGWRERLEGFVRAGWRTVLQYRFDKLSDVVGAAIECKADVQRAVQAPTSRKRSADAGPVGRKWEIQRLRRALGRALYFADNDDLISMTQICSEFPELAETGAVCAALLGDCNEVLRMPGGASAAFAQASRTRMWSRGAIEIDESVAFVDKRVVAEAVSVISLSGGAVSFGVSELPADAACLVDFCLRDPIPVPEVPTSGYGGELLSLGTGVSLEEKRRIACTRFSSSEDVVLDALSLGSGYLS